MLSTLNLKFREPETNEEKMILPQALKVFDNMTPYVGMRPSMQFFVQDNCETRSGPLDTAGRPKSRTTKVEKGRGSTELVVVSTRPCQHWCSVLGLLRSGSRALPVVAL